MEGLHAFVAVAFVEPAPVGERFGKRHWPLHVTLLRFDMAPEAAVTAAAGAFAFLAGSRPLRVEVAHDADFGYRGRVRVSLLAPHARLQRWHEAIRDAVSSAAASDGARIHSPQHTGRGFRPHVTVQGRGDTQRRVHAGQTVELPTVSLVDMAPGGDTEWRLPVAEWKAGG